MRSAADQTPVVVVANKTDLVRTRQVAEDGQYLFNLSSADGAFVVLYGRIGRCGHAQF